MRKYSLSQRLVAEMLGSGFLTATVIGSGIMATNLSPDRGLGLLCNALATGAILVVLITLFKPISGAHFNPLVTLVFTLKKQMRVPHAIFYLVAQIIGGVLGTVLTHGMFDLALISFSAAIRNGNGQYLSEVIASFGLVMTILAGQKANEAHLPWLVGLYITGAYWFTASTAFANPAITLARALTASFAGISLPDVPVFIIAQLCGGVCGLYLMNWLLHPVGDHHDHHHLS